MPSSEPFHPIFQRCPLPISDVYFQYVPRLSQYHYIWKISIGNFQRAVLFLGFYLLNRFIIFGLLDILILRFKVLI